MDGARRRGPGPLRLGQEQRFGRQRAITARLLLFGGDAVGMIVADRLEPRLGGGVGAVSAQHRGRGVDMVRSEEHTSELQSLMRISYAVFCLKKKKKNITKHNDNI